MYQPPGSDEVSWAPKDDDRLTFNDDLQIIIYLNLQLKDHLISSKGSQKEWDNIFHEYYDMNYP